MRTSDQKLARERGQEMRTLTKESYYTECHECDAVCEGVGELDKESGDLYGLVCPNCGEFDVLNWADNDEEEEGE